MYEEYQRRYVTREMTNLLRRQGCWFLVEPAAERRVGKLLQMIVAKGYFVIPPWAVVRSGRPLTLPRPLVVKALAQTAVGEMVYPVTTRCSDPTQLSSAFTWFLQTEVAATYDITIIFCCGKYFAYCMSRSHLSQPDWRIDESAYDEGMWKEYRLHERICDDINRFMVDLDLSFGRLDFLLDSEDQLHFLEVNPNGQYAWCDPDDRTGLLSWIFRCARTRP